MRRDSQENVMAKRPRARSEARDTATLSNPPLTPREAASSTAIDITRERTDETLDSGIASTGPDEDEIRRRAYQRYLERGGGDGQDFDDWLEAERELKQQS
jgi:Protein of unknown function (DUF2934)